MQRFAHHPGRLLARWGTVRLRMTLWNVAVLALILGAMGGVVRYTVRADLFATVDRTLAERAYEAGRRYAIGPPYARRNSRTAGQSRLLDPMTATAEGSQIGSTKPGVLPPLEPRVIPRDPANGPPGCAGTNRGIDSRTIGLLPDGRSIRLCGMARRLYGYCRCPSSAGARSMRCFSSPIRSTAFCGRSTR